MNAFMPLLGCPAKLSMTLQTMAVINYRALDTFDETTFSTLHTMAEMSHELSMHLLR